MVKKTHVLPGALFAFRCPVTTVFNHDFWNMAGVCARADLFFWVLCCSVGPRGC